MNGRHCCSGTAVSQGVGRRERVLGPDHPDTLISVNNLAALLEHRGDTVARNRYFAMRWKGVNASSVRIIGYAPLSQTIWRGF